MLCFTDLFILIDNIIINIIFLYVFNLFLIHVDFGLWVSLCRVFADTSIFL